MSSIKKVLLIDDEDDIREVATMTLETMAGLEVITADNGLAGLARAESEQPDAILLDVMMPGIDGVETYRRMQESEATRAIPVIFMTAKVQAGERQRLADLGARGIIAKPFDPMTLSDEVLALLER
jgi:two-component system, OmpR family, alkaline phosphatase synthesis response regulator PhoP